MGVLSGNARAQGCFDALAHCRLVAEPGTPPFDNEVLWLEYKSAIEGLTDGLSEFIVNIRNENPITLVTTPSWPSGSWPVGTGNGTGHVNSYARAWSTATRLYTDAWLELDIEGLGDWPEAQLELLRDMRNAGVPNLRFDAAQLVTAARRVGPPWEQATA